MEREGTAVTCDGRLFHRRAAVTGNALSPTVDRQVRRTSRDDDEAERSRRLDSVSAGQLKGDLCPNPIKHVRDFVHQLTVLIF